MDDSYITVSSEKVTELALKRIDIIKADGEEQKKLSLERVEKDMRERRWWGLVGPWYTSDGPPSDKTIYLWAQQSFWGYADHTTRQFWDGMVKSSVAKAQKYIDAAKDGDPFLLTMADYQWLASVKRY